MKHLLKIEKKFWDLIVSGEKQFEVRKTNKDYINIGDQIYFTDLAETVIYGKRVVSYKEYFDLALFRRVFSIDTKTISYVLNNYQYEDKIIVFKIKESEIDE